MSQQAIDTHYAWDTERHQWKALEYDATANQCMIKTWMPLGWLPPDERLLKATTKDHTKVSDAYTPSAASTAMTTQNPNPNHVASGVLKYHEKIPNLLQNARSSYIAFRQPCIDPDESLFFNATRSKGSGHDINERHDDLREISAADVETRDMPGSDGELGHNKRTKMVAGNERLDLTDNGRRDRGFGILGHQRGNIQSEQGGRALALRTEEDQGSGAMKRRRVTEIPSWNKLEKLDTTDMEPHNLMCYVASTQAGLKISRPSEEQSYLDIRNTTPVASNRLLHAKMEPATNGRSFFKKGRVFMAVWSEPKGFTEEAFVELARFAVVRPKPTFSVCLRISTYSGQGTTKAGVDARDHAAIIPVGGTFMPHPKGERLNKGPIEVKLENPEISIDSMSRINCAKPYTVEHNIRVRNIGRVVGVSVGLLDKYFAESLGHIKP